MANFVRKKKGISWIPTFSLKSIIAVSPLFLFILLPAVLFLTQHRADQRTHASASQSIYPANIQLDGGQFEYKYGAYNQAALENPNIKGVVIRLDWSDVELSQGNFNWGPFDQEAQDWIAAGKKFAIVVRFANEPNPQVTCNGSTHMYQYLPDWEIARIPTLCTAGGVIIPNYFNATFQSDLVSFITAITQHIQAQGYQNSLLYARFALGQGGEGYDCIGCNSSDLGVLNNQWGYSSTAWRDWQEQMLLKYQQAFPLAPIIFAMGGGNVIDPANGQPVYHEVATFALQHNMGLGQEGVNPKDKYTNGDIVSFLQQARQQYPNAYIELAPIQQLKFSASSSCDMHCVAQDDINTANTAGAWTLEWYPDDAGNPALNDVFSAWQAMVDLRTPSPTPTPSFTPTPTPSPTMTPTPTLSPTPTPTPTLPPRLGYDYFKRRNQQYWGNGTDGQAWTGQANSSIAFSIVNNSGVVSNTSGENLYDALYANPSTNEAISLQGSITTLGQKNTLGGLLRYTDANNCYIAEFDGINLVIAKRVAGVRTVLASTPFAASANTQYRLDFRITGSTLVASVWIANSSKPANWMTTAADTSLTTGYGGIRTHLTGVTTANYTQFQAFRF